MLKKAIAQIMNYLRLSGETVAGYSYGTDRMPVTSAGQAALHAMVSQRWHALYREPMPYTAEEVALAWIDVRKGNYRSMRDGIAIATAEVYPLFEVESESAEPVAIVYAYWGRNQNADRRLVKIGYTAQELAGYLRGLQRQYDPQLIATKPGGREEERDEHRMWRHFLAEGREWFYPCEAMFGHFARTWRTTPQFAELMREALYDRD